MYQQQVSTILRGMRSNYAAFYEDKIFAGPSLHFHLAALEASRRGRLAEFATNSYAMLASWGMHRMGAKGAKMGTFEDYKASLAGVWDSLKALRRLTPETLSKSDMAELRHCFDSIRVMRSDSILVAHSKVLAHAVPNLVAPIDREYTVRFLRGYKSVPSSPENQGRWFEDFHTGFYYPLVAHRRFMEHYQMWSASRQPWDSSPLKVADNLVIGHARRMRALETDG
jgi:hypothetical protein